jgi:hypothetical protein
MRLKSIPHNKIVCLIGSTKFKKEFEEATLNLGLKGYIVLSVICYNHGDLVGLSREEKTAADELHHRKIELADEIYVINPGGYIGSSSAGEITYAERLEKPISYLVSPPGTKVSPFKWTPGQEKWNRVVVGPSGSGMSFLHDNLIDISQKAVPARRTGYDEVTEFLHEIKGELACRCDGAYTGRGLHAPDCRFHLSVEASRLLDWLTIK